jgi:CBS domain-containing protein
VVQDEKLVGIISIGDIIKAIIVQQKIAIDHLENYIMGKYL